MREPVVLTEYVLLNLVNNKNIQNEIPFIRLASSSMQVKKTGCCGRSKGPNFYNIARNIKMSLVHASEEIIKRIKQELKTDKLIIYIGDTGKQSRIER